MRVVVCPQCGSEAAWEGNPHRPFCSERCRMVDLGAWLDEKYAIPGPLADESAEEDAPAPPRDGRAGKGRAGG